MRNKSLLRIIIVLTSIVLLTQCERNNVSIEHSIPVTTINISSSKAANIAASFWEFSSSPQGRIGSKNVPTPVTLTIKNVSSYKANQDTIFHVVEYQNGGWAVVSGDRRVTPILAYSEKGSFPLVNIPEEVQVWINIVTRNVQKVRRENIKINSALDFTWKRLETRLTDSQNKSSSKGPITNVQQPLCDPNNIQCPPDYNYSVEPIMGDLGWGQAGGYANNSPDRSFTGTNCASCFNNALTGCGPLAIARILFYYNTVLHYDKPSGYNLTANFIYNPCGQLTAGEAELARLIRFAGDHSDTHYNEPQCNTATLDVTTTTTPFLAAGYSQNGDVVDFDSHIDDIIGELHSNYPIILSGTTCGTCLGAYHIWICHGIRVAKSYTPTCVGGPTGQGVCMDTSSLNFYMDWGQFDQWNGWYGLSNFQMDGETYDTYMKAHIHIRP